MTQPSHQKPELFCSAFLGTPDARQKCGVSTDIVLGVVGYSEVDWPVCPQHLKLVAGALLLLFGRVSTAQWQSREVTRWGLVQLGTSRDAQESER